MPHAAKTSSAAKRSGAASWRAVMPFFRIALLDWDRTIDRSKNRCDCPEFRAPNPSTANVSN